MKNSNYNSIFNVNFFMSILFFVVSNIFIYFLIFQNVFYIYWGPNELTIKFIFWFFAEIIVFLLSRCLYTIDRNEINHQSYHNGSPLLP